MKGDFTRNTYDRQKHYLGVLMQQGRVLLDADWNEQLEILLHYLQNLAADLIGPAGGWPDSAFKIEAGGTGLEYDFKINPGHYYVHGLLCENDKGPILYTEQDDYPFSEAESLKLGFHLVYLDVWRRHITYVQDPSIREVALKGPDTASRVQLVWQVKTLLNPDLVKGTMTCNTLPWNKIVKHLKPPHRGKLIAKAEVIEPPLDPCTLPPGAQYRGQENQLYRVEIHRPGLDGSATFKWSRDNGSCIYPIEEIEGTVVKVSNLGLDDQRSLKSGDWVEIVDDKSVLLGHFDPLLEVKSVKPDEGQVILEREPQTGIGRDPDDHPLLRRWDHKIKASTTSQHEDPEWGDLFVHEGTWIALEDGVQIWFDPPQETGDSESGAEEEEPPVHCYCTGDYWLIPARTETGSVEWARDQDGDLLAVTPHGVDHHYAPLGVIHVKTGGAVELTRDCRKIIQHANIVAPPTGGG